MAAKQTVQAYYQLQADVKDLIKLENKIAKIEQKKQTERFFKSDEDEDSIFEDSDA